jgi:hypothetical protein
MIIPSGRIELVVSQEVVRYNLTNLWLDVEKKRLVGSDGTMLAIVPVEVEAGDVSGPVDPQVLDQGRKAARKISKWTPPRMECRADTYLLADGITIPRAMKDGEGDPFGYPPIDKVMVHPEDRNCALSFDIEKAYRLWKGMTSDTKGKTSAYVTLFFKTKPNKDGDYKVVDSGMAFDVGTPEDGAQAVLMPVSPKLPPKKPVPDPVVSETKGA